MINIVKQTHETGQPSFRHKSQPFKKVFTWRMAFIKAFEYIIHRFSANCYDGVRVSAWAEMWRNKFCAVNARIPGTFLVSIIFVQKDCKIHNKNQSDFALSNRYCSLYFDNSSMQFQMRAALFLPILAPVLLCSPWWWRLVPSGPNIPLLAIVRITAT